MQTCVLSCGAPLDNLDSAMNLAEQGLYVFPLWRAIDGRCEAPWAHECKKPGKHPRVKWGQYATCDSQNVMRWWRKWPQANIGIATGPSGLAVLDVDPKTGGLESFKSLCEAIPGLGTSVPKVLTGGEGFHLYYAQPSDSKIPNSEGRPGRGIAPGIDTRGIGGYVVAPPSVHANGTQYRWIRGLRFPLEPFPAPLQAMIARKSRKGSAKGTKSVAPLGELDANTLIPDGSRNGSFASYAGSLRVAGMDPQEMFTLLRCLRDHHCENPETFTDSEIIQIVWQSYNYDRIAWPAYLDWWIRSGASGSEIKYLATIGLQKGRNIPNPSIAQIAKVSGMAKSTQLKCRRGCEAKGLMHAHPGAKGQAAKITLLPPAVGGTQIDPIIKTSRGVSRDQPFLSEQKSVSEGSPSSNGAALNKDRPKATITDIFAKPRKRRSQSRVRSISNPSQEALRPDEKAAKTA